MTDSAPKLTGHARSMLMRFAVAGEWGIDRRFVPDLILIELQEAGFVTKLETKPRITEVGRSALSTGGEP